MKRDERIDAYIARQADFARPILEHLRALVHSACPEAEETLKWSMPAFVYKGEILATMAAFKQHASFGLWRGSLVLGEEEKRQGAMGQYGRLTSIEDLPQPEELAGHIRKAMELTQAGVKPVRNKSAKAPLEMPEDLRAALDANAEASATYEGFSPSARREYLEWVLDAKQPATRQRRIAQAVEWMAEGKKKNWKYEKC
ncbi:MAG TPA: YdeI/OmpD-associated family protein [Allosphingosinicella sp.]|nr:YdeI/OmpD-associated family protein [Allosphingosinicella sp.]